jgi:hypothetical protein
MRYDVITISMHCSVFVWDTMLLHGLAVDPCFARERVWDDLPTFTCPKSLFLARHNAYLYFSEYV